jgi:hypothetical protein
MLAANSYMVLGGWFAIAIGLMIGALLDMRKKDQNARQA